MTEPGRSVELHQAFVWTCEDCGLENFERTVTVDPERVADVATAAQMAEATDYIVHMEGLDTEAGAGVTWLMAPERVTCQACGAEFAVERHGEE